MLTGEAKSSGEPGWKWRRIIIYPVVAFACWRLMGLENATDSELNQLLAWGWLMLVAVLVLGYTGFATVQDIIAIWTARSGLPYAKPQSGAG